MISPFSQKADVEILTIIGILLNKYGPEWISWEVETLRMELIRDFEDVSEIAFQKVCAAQIASAHDIAWKEWEVFEKVCAACNHSFPIFSMTQPPEPEEIVVTLSTLAKISNNDYSEEVLKYIGAACLNDGLVYLDGMLSIAQENVDMYHDQNGFFIDKNKIEKSIPNAPYTSPDNYAEVQANRVHAIRAVLTEFHKELEKERKTYAYLLG